MFSAGMATPKGFFHLLNSRQLMIGGLLLFYNNIMLEEYLNVYDVYWLPYTSGCALDLCFRDLRIWSQFSRGLVLFIRFLVLTVRMFTLDKLVEHCVNGSLNIRGL